MFTVLHLAQFPLQAALRHEPELWQRPVALVDPAATTPRVVEFNAGASAAGITRGLTPTQALARCRAVLIRHRSPAQERSTTDAVLQAAYAFSPNLENTAPGMVTIDLRGLPVLPVGETIFASAEEALRTWAARLQSAVAALNLTARIGIGPTPNLAQHAARWGGGIDIVREPRAFVDALPVAALEPSTDVTLILQKWGIRTVGELLALGQDAVADRLGLEAMALFAAASVTGTRPLNLVRPSEHYEEAFDFEQTVETMEPLLFILRRFVDHLSQRLELAGLAAERLALSLRLESGELLERSLRVPQPTRQADVLFRMLHTHLESLRTESPIASVALKAVPTQPEQKQFTLFEAALRDPHQFQETLARLSALVGSERVGTPIRENSHRVDAFKLVPPDFENAPSQLSQRVPEILRATPLRKFRPMKKAQVEMESETTGARVARRDEKLFVPFPLTPALSRGEREMSSSSSRKPKRSDNGTTDQTPGDERFLFPLPSGEARGEGNPDTPIQSESHSPTVENARPLSLQCAVSKGQLKISVGPWRTSGHWWEPAAWQREEWDVQTRDGQVLRLVRVADDWFVEGVLD